MELLTYQKSENLTEIKPFPKKEPDTHCNGKVHRQERYCQRPAGWGTNHAGSGRCKLHGGCSTGKCSGQLRYSDFISKEILEKYEEFALEADVDIKSLNDEIALIRSKITYLETHPNFYNNDLILKFTELVRRLVETKQKVEEGVKSKVVIEVVVKIVDDVINIINKRVQDAETKRLIARDMKDLNFERILLN